MNKEDLSKIKVKLTSLDKAFELIGWLLLIGIWVFTLMNYRSLPDTIPIHYNFAGEPDGFGNKWNLLTLPIIASVLLIGMTFLNKYPHHFNYPDTITEETAQKSFIIATRLIRVLKLAIVLIFGMIVFRTMQNINGTAEGLGAWFLPVTLGMIFIPMTYFLIKSTRKQKSGKV